MKILLATDTHGHLDSLNIIARKHAVSAILHAGDFGFYDLESCNRLSNRELKLRIRNSSLSDLEKEKLFLDTPENQREYIRSYLPLSNLPDYISGKKKFDVPVYTVWGNHEDREVLNRYLDGRYTVDNLFLLHENASYHLDSLHILGLGGNFIIGEKLFQKPVAGSASKVWSVLEQYTQLLKTLQSNQIKEEQRIFVSHVSPGREPFITLMGIKSQARLILSGHMHPPLPLIWNEAAVRSPEEAIERISKRLSEIKEKKVQMTAQKSQYYYGQLEKFALNEPLPDKGWYQEMFNINLPGIADGYAIVEINETGWTFLPGSNFLNHLKTSSELI